MTADVFGESLELAEGQIDPLSPEHVVNLVRFLASPASEGVNGQLFIVYGPTVTLVCGADGRATVSVRNPTHGTRRSCRKLCRITLLTVDPERNFSATALMGQGE